MTAVDVPVIACAGSHVAAVDAEDTALCGGCGQTVGTYSDARVRRLVEHTRPLEVRRRRCAVCGALVQPGEVWCSTVCHRADEPGAYDDSAFEDFDDEGVAV